ncbi:DUF4142 domain-containing protein [Falsiroseomonas oryzae]|uniref:DUF4142 domain-containing protein n=1 Tax=Falsiroseomonas oryzae TaxID=2766473 RepID=UPI0022EB5D91|nr:DUF4142 domain-containing protein [Roseomonas sp. MO-31]
MRRRILATGLLALPLAAQFRPAAAQLNVIQRLAPTPVGTDAFVTLAAISDMFEIESSRFLLIRSAHPQIREFAQRMIEHHTAMSNEMMAIPTALNRMPTRLDDRHAVLLATLRRQETVDFVNRTYVQQQIEGHEEATAAYDAYANAGDDDAIQAFAQRHAPMIRQHLAMARTLQAPRND